MKPWKLIKTEEIQLDKWRTITRKFFLKPNGEEKDYYIWGEVGYKYASIIALTKDNQVIISEEFRPAPQIIAQDIPSGKIDEGEDPETAAKRELLEETGYASDDMEFLGTSYLAGYEHPTAYCYLARNCQKVAEQNLEPDEEINVKLISIDQLIDNAMNDRMADKAAVLFAYEKLKKIKEES